MPTPIDTFWAILTITRVLSDVQRTLRQTSQNFQGWYHNGPGPLQGNLAATQQGIRDFGLGQLQILATVKALYDTYPTELTAAAVAPLPTFTALQAAYSLVFTWATNMNTVTLASGADLDAKVAALLAAVPPTMLPYQ